MFLILEALLFRAGSLALMTGAGGAVINRTWSTSALAMAVFFLGGWRMHPPLRSEVPASTC